MIKSVAVLLIVFSSMSASAGEFGRTQTVEYTEANNNGMQITTTDITSEYATGVTEISYSSNSENFYFWLDEFDWTDTGSICIVHEKFGVRVEPTNAPLIDQVKMAFLSGKQIKVTWNTGACTGGGVRPHYIKIYR